MGKSEKAALMLLVILTVCVLVAIASWIAGERYILGGLLKDGYSVTFDESVSPGEGFYIVRIWRDGSWVAVER